MDKTIEYKDNKENIQILTPWLRYSFQIILCITIGALVFITYQSIQGYNDLIGIKYVKNDFKPLKQLYVLNCLFVILFICLLVLFKRKINQFAHCLLNEQYYGCAQNTFTMFELLRIHSFLTLLFYGNVLYFCMDTAINHSFNEDWDSESIRFVEYRYDCCMSRESNINDHIDCKSCWDEFHSRLYFGFISLSISSLMLLPIAIIMAKISVTIENKFLSIINFRKNND